MSKSLITIDALKIILDSFKNIMACEENIINDNYNEKIGGKEISIIINNTLDNSKTIYDEIDTFILTDIPEDNYTLQGFATENGGAVVYNISDKLTEDAELWTVYQRQIGYLYNSEDDAAWANGTYNTYSYIPFTNPISFSGMYKNTSGYYTVAKLHFTVEMDSDSTEDYVPGWWPNGISGSSFPAFGAEEWTLTPLGDNLYDLSYDISEYDLFPELTFAGLDQHNITPRTYDDWADHYFKVRDDFRIELEPDTVELTLSAITDSDGVPIAPLSFTHEYTPINLDSSFDLVEGENFDVYFYGTDISTGDPAEARGVVYDTTKLDDGSWYGRLEQAHISEMNVEQIKVNNRSDHELQTGVISVYA